MIRLLTRLFYRDHFIPLSKGGLHISGNIIPACRFHNQSKKDNMPNEWVVKKFGINKYKEIVGKLNELQIRRPK